ncbi:MAG: DNA internalization-related competence protein ComEC/Rec2 [Chloroflexi bacterium]|nr:DNA internalization-related competence protein ComEC/Rec2 [Chloroflexota bacterium]
MKQLVLAGVFLGGVFLADWLRPSWEVWALLFIAGGLLFAVLLLSKKSLLAAVVIMALALGLFRVQVTQASQVDGLVNYIDQPVAVEGVVRSYPEQSGAFSQFQFAVERVQVDDVWSDASGTVLVFARPSTEMAELRSRLSFRYGDQLRLGGQLELPPQLEDFDYAAYLAREGIHWTMSFPRVVLLEEGQGNPYYQWLYGVRRGLADAISDAVPEPQASVGQAMVLGLREGIPDSLTESFRSAGLSHVLAISGLHVGIVLFAVLAASRRLFGRRWGLYLIAPLVVLWLYALLAGMSPSVIRAAVMGTVYLTAMFLGRPSSVLPSLGLAAAAMVLVSPDALWSISFQLSFAAVAGIALLTEPVATLLRSLTGLHNGPGRMVTGAVSVTLAATLATIPLTAFYFQGVSLMGIPATLLVLPALPLIIATVVLVGIVGLASSAVAVPLGWVAWVPTAYVTAIADALSRVPGAQFETGTVGPVFVFVYYAVLAGLVVVTPLRRWIERLRVEPGERQMWLREDWKLLLPTGILIVLAILLWVAATSAPDGKLHVTFFDVGQGDSILIETPNGRRVLIDGGPDPLQAVRLLGERDRFFDRNIELVVLTQPHADHVTGLVEVLRRYRVSHILEPQTEYESPPYAAWRQALAHEGTVVTRAESGQVFLLDEGVVLEVLAPPTDRFVGTRSDVDNASVVLRLTYGDVSFLFTADIYTETEHWLIRTDALINATVLKVAHHGSRSSSLDDFLDRVQPTFAVIPAGQDNRFGHPHPETLQTLWRYVSPEHVVTTGENGSIEVVTDGTRATMKTER